MYIDLGVGTYVVHIRKVCIYHAYGIWLSITKANDHLELPRRACCGGCGHPFVQCWASDMVLGIPPQCVEILVKPPRIVYTTHSLHVV